MFRLSSSSHSRGRRVPRHSINRGHRVRKHSTQQGRPVSFKDISSSNRCRIIRHTRVFRASSAPHQASTGIRDMELSLRCTRKHHRSRVMEDMRQEEGTVSLRLLRSMRLVQRLSRVRILRVHLLRLFSNPRFMVLLSSSNNRATELHRRLRHPHTCKSTFNSSTLPPQHLLPTASLTHTNPVQPV